MKHLKLAAFGCAVGIATLEVVSGNFLMAMVAAAFAAYEYFLISKRLTN